MSDPEIIHLHGKKGRVDMHMIAIPLGGDLSVTLSGGDTPHIGSVALGQPNSGGLTTVKAGAAVSQINLAGHKDHVVTGKMAEKLAALSGGTVTVSGGIHVDAISPEEIDLVLELADELTADLIARLYRVPGK